MKLLSKFLLIAFVFVGAVLAQSPTPTPEPRVSGRVTYYGSGYGVPFVVVIARSEQGMVMVTTDAQGYYTLWNFQPGTAYTIAPQKNANNTFGECCSDAVTSYDAALTAWLASGATNPHPLSMFAADVTENNEVSSFDAAHIGTYAVFGHGYNNGSHTGQWRFQPTSRAYAAITVNVTDVNFVAVMLGEVSGNWLQPTPPPSPTPINLNPAVWPSATPLIWPPTPTGTRTPYP